MPDSQRMCPIIFQYPPRVLNLKIVHVGYLYVLNYMLISGSIIDGKQYE